MHLNQGGSIILSFMKLIFNAVAAEAAELPENFPQFHATPAVSESCILGH